MGAVVPMAISVDGQVLTKVDLLQLPLQQLRAI